VSESSPKDRRLRFLLMLGEGLLLFLALVCVNLLFSTSAQRLDSGSLLGRGLVVVAVVQLSLYYTEVYDLRALRSRTDLFLRLGRSTLLAAFLLPFVYYLLPPARLAPRLLVPIVPLALAGIVLWHSLVYWVADREALTDNVLILGSGHTARQVAFELLRRAPLGYRVLGFLGEHADEVGRIQTTTASVVGTTDQLLRTVSERRANLIVVALDDRRGRLPVDDLLRCRVAGIRVEDAPTFYERLTGKLLVSDLRPSWLVFSPGFHKPRLVLASRRVIEFAAAALLLLALSPLLALLALLIRLDSAGPAVFRQPRVGLGGAVFDLLKLRTMRVDAEAGTGPTWAAPDHDRRVTRLGRVLRALRLDELPQLVNVLRGEMSFVGPRPERPHFVEQLRKVIPYYDQRHNVPPGITGWAQVKFGYGSTIEDAERKLQFDLYYIKNMSPFLDLAIVLDTLKVMLLARGAR
jgi:sugar transferase (PEP-CTERM system associated)